MPDIPNLRGLVERYFEYSSKDDDIAHEI